jgi:hypothetical protein
MAGCIEGKQRPSIDNVTPRACESALAPDTRFTLLAHYDSAFHGDIERDLPRFELEIAGARLAMDTVVTPDFAIEMVPRAPLPADTDLALHLLDRGAFADAYITAGLFPATYTTREAPRVRNYRAVDGHVFVSFSQPLDAETVAVTVTRDGAPVSAATQYLAAADHVVHVQITDHGQRPVQIVFDPALQTRSGAPVQATVELSPAYTLPADNGCTVFH